jgi:hypothetical protein
MLTFDDPRWPELEAGFRTPIDLRPLLRQLEEAREVEPAWCALWEETYHHGDVGPSSYVAVPHIVRIHKVRAGMDWNTYALVALIEAARGMRGNPDVPEWARHDYNCALHDLAKIGFSELPQVTSAEAARSILALLALVYGIPTYGRLLIEYTEDELNGLLEGASCNSSWAAGSVSSSERGVFGRELHRAG